MLGVGFESRIVDPCVSLSASQHSTTIVVTACRMTTLIGCGSKVSRAAPPGRSHGGQDWMNGTAAPMEAYSIADWCRVERGLWWREGVGGFEERHHERMRYIRI